jgi:hypothetical protein
MTSEIFAEWLQAFDLRMQRLGKEKALLLLDNFSGHKASKMRDLPELRCTEILYLPANTTSKLQPLDAGIIRNFKLYYHKRFNRYILQRLEMLDTVRVRGVIDMAMGLNRQSSTIDKPLQPAYINLRSAIDLLVSAWNDISPHTIHNCFRHCGIRTPFRDNPGNEQVEAFSEIGLDQGAIQDINNTHELLSSKRPELFPGHLDIQSLINDSSENIIGPDEDDNLDEDQLLTADDDEEMPPPEDDSEEAPKISRQEAMTLLLSLKMYLQQQDEDTRSQQAMVKRMMDHIESKRILQLEQTSILTYFQ